MGRLFLLSLRVLAAIAPALSISCGSSSPTTPTSPSTPGLASLPPLEQMLAEKAMGNPAAANTVVGYSSFTCPHCAAFHTGTLPQLKTKHIDTGNARFVFRDFPLDTTGQQAAMLARCMGDARYFEAVDRLFASQGSWASGNTQALAAVMLGLGMSQATIDACLADSDLRAGIMKIRQNGADQFGINAVPTFIVNGDKVVGNVPLSELEQHFKQ